MLRIKNYCGVDWEPSSDFTRLDQYLHIKMRQIKAGKRLLEGSSQVIPMVTGEKANDIFKTLERDLTRLEDINDGKIDLSETGLNLSLFLYLDSDNIYIPGAACNYRPDGSFFSGWVEGIGEYNDDQLLRNVPRWLSSIASELAKDTGWDVLVVVNESRSLMLMFKVNYDIEHPTSYLTALVKKMNRWAK